MTYPQGPGPHEQPVPPLPGHAHYPGPPGRQPDFAPQPGPPSRPGRSAALIAGAAVIILGGGALTFAATTGGSGNGSASAPPPPAAGDTHQHQAHQPAAASDQDTARQAAETYAAVWQELFQSRGEHFDESTSDKVTCGKLTSAAREMKADLDAKRQQLAPDDPYWSGAGTISITASGVSAAGDTGQAGIEFHSSTVNDTKTLELVKEDGLWKVCGPK